MNFGQLSKWPENESTKLDNIKAVTLLKNSLLVRTIW